MLRLLGGLGLLASVAFVVVLLAAPTALYSWTDDGTASMLAAVAAAAVGVWLTVLIVLFYVVFRYRRLVKAAEQLAAGKLEVSVKASAKGRGLDNRLARAINTIAAKLAETTDAATTDKLTGVANRRALLVDLFNEVERANRYERPLSVAFVDIDHFKAVNDTFGHAAGDEVLRGVAQAISVNLPGDRHDRPVRRRGVHAAPDRDERGGGRGPHREASEHRREGALRRRRPDDLGHDLDRHRRRRRRPAH